MILDTDLMVRVKLFVVPVFLIVLGYILYKVFSGAWILPQYFTVGLVTIHYYGIAMALAVLAGYVFAVRRAPQYGIPAEFAEKLIFYGIVGGFIGARLYHVASSWQFYLRHPLNILEVWNGGLGIFGALIGGVIAGIVIYILERRKIVRRGFIAETAGHLNPNASNVFTHQLGEDKYASSLRTPVSAYTQAERSNLNNQDEIASSSHHPQNSNEVKLLAMTQREQFSILSLLDWGILPFVLGQIIGRFGNLFNYEAFGYPTNLPWHMFVPAQFRPQGLGLSTFYHPLFLYEAIGNVIILFFLLWVERRRSLPIHRPNQPINARTTLTPGAIFFTYLFLYNTLRFFIELLRTDSTWIHGVRLNSITSGILAIVAILGLLILSRRKFSITD